MRKWRSARRSACGEIGKYPVEQLSSSTSTTGQPNGRSIFAVSVTRLL